MPNAIQGEAQDIYISFDDGVTFKTLVCLQSGSVDNEVNTTEEETNCGPILSVGDMKASASFDAVCETAPSGSQCTYKDLLTAMNDKTVIVVKYENPVVTGASTGAVYHQTFDAYVTALSNSYGIGNGLVKFSGTIQSTGVIDIVA